MEEAGTGGGHQVSADCSRPSRGTPSAMPRRVNPPGERTRVSEVQLIAHHTMKPGTENEALSLLEQLIDAPRSEPGNLAFDAYRSFRDPNTYVLLERYSSRDALAAH